MPSEEHIEIHAYYIKYAKVQCGCTLLYTVQLNFSQCIFALAEMGLCRETFAKYIKGEKWGPRYKWPSWPSFLFRL
jgi:hypothetical protein